MSDREKRRTTQNCDEYFMYDDARYLCGSRVWSLRRLLRVKLSVPVQRAAQTLVSKMAY